MDDLGFNKIAGAVLATGLGMLLLMKLPGLVMAQPGEEIAYKVGALPVAGGDAAPVDLPFPQQSWVDAMDAAKGAKVFKKCKSCHNVDPGGANGTGPALHGVVGNDIGAAAGFKFSTALTGIDGNWTYEALDAFLKKPSKYAPGTKMNFVGLKKDADRAAVIEYLRVADASPEAQPTAVAAEAETASEEMVDGEMVKEEMASDVMEKDATTKDEMTKDEMVKDEMAPETMEKDTMEKDAMEKIEMIKDTMEKVETPE